MNEVWYSVMQLWLAQPTYTGTAPMQEPLNLGGAGMNSQWCPSTHNFRDTVEDVGRHEVPGSC